MVLVVLAGAALRSLDLTRPWIGVHNAWGGAMYGTIARNYVKYGYVATQLGPVVNSGEATPAQFEYYYHYPPLLVWMVSASFQVFGVHEWSARLVPLVFSIALMGLIFAMARRFFSDPVALLALMYSAALPIEIYYGTHVDVYGSIVVFFTTLALYAYARWADARRTRDLTVCVAAVALGCMTAWYTFFIVPLLVGHHWLSTRSGERDRRILLLGVAAVAVFVLFLAHRRVLMAGGRGEVEGSLLEKLLVRITLATPEGDSSVLSVAKKHARDLVRMYTVPVLLLAAAWVGFFVRDALRKRLQTRDWMLLFLFAYGFVHNLAFPSFLIGHDFLVVCYVPAMSIAAAAATWRLGESARRWGATARLGAVAALAMILVGAELREARALRAGDSDFSATLARWGEAIQRQTRPTDLVLSCGREDRVFQYYVDRRMEFAIDDAVTLARAAPRASVFVCPQRLAAEHSQLLAGLSAPGGPAAREHDGLLVYALRR